MPCIAMATAQPLIEPQAHDPIAEGAVIAGKYRVERVLGKGGMGIVVAAVHEHLQERVAIKLICGNGIGEHELVTRFVREARAAAKIKSTHVVRVLDIDTLGDGLPYMVMEYLEGHDLAKELSLRGRLPQEEAVDYILQACQAAAAAHDLGIVHRDLKPSNLFLVPNGRGPRLVKILDFGISKTLTSGAAADSIEAALTATSALMGSPAYMSPEQIRSPRSVNERTDIWSLGVILYQMLSGRRPFRAASSAGVLAAVYTDTPVPLRQCRPDISDAVERVVADCLNKNPAHRPLSVREVASTLLPFASGPMRAILEHTSDIPISRPMRVVSVDPAPPEVTDGEDPSTNEAEEIVISGVDPVTRPHRPVAGSEIAHPLPSSGVREGTIMEKTAQGWVQVKPAYGHGRSILLGATGVLTCIAITILFLRGAPAPPAPASAPPTASGAAVAAPVTSAQAQLPAASTSVTTAPAPLASVAPSRVRPLAPARSKPRTAPVEAPPRTPKDVPIDEEVTTRR